MPRYSPVNRSNMATRHFNSRVAGMALPNAQVVTTDKTDSHQQDRGQDERHDVSTPSEPHLCDVGCQLGAQSIRVGGHHLAT